MSTRLSARNLFPPLDNLELTIRRRSRSDPTLLNNSEIAAEGPDDLPAPDLWTMKELCQPSLNGRGSPIAPIAIQAKNFELKNDMIQQISIDRCLNHNMLPVTQIATFYNGLTLRHRDTINVVAGGTFMKRRPEECYDLIENMTAHHNDWDTSAQQSESSSSINSSFDTKITALKVEMAKINKNLMRVIQVNQQVKAVTPNCETCGGPHSFSDCPATVGNTQNVYAAKAYQGNSYQPQGSRNLLSYRLKNYLGPPGFNQNQNRNNQNHNFQNQNRNQETIILMGITREETNSSRKLTKIPQPQVVTTNEFTNFMKANDVIIKNMQTNMTSLTNSNLELKNMFGQFIKMNTALSSGSETLPGNTITNPKEDLKGITTRSGTAYPGPTIPTTTSSSSLVVERETEATKDTVHPANNESTEDVQPLVDPTESPILTSEPVNSLIVEPVASPISALRPNQRPSIPYPSRLHEQKLRDKANDQREKFFQIFKDLNFNISFTDALILMPKFGPSIKSLLTNKDKLCELARTLLNEHCSEVLRKKLLEKLGDPNKFLIPCDFLEMAECLALADLGATINLMPLSVLNKLPLPDLSPMCMTLELTNRSISRPVGVAKDVFVKVGTFHFSVDFVVVDFDADPRVPLILGRSFLKIGRALIDVFEGKLTLHVGKEAITFNLDQISRYSANYNNMTANRIDVLDMACEEYSQEVLGFFDVIASGNPTPYYDPIISTTSLTLTPFGNSDFLLKEVDAFLAIEDDSTSLEELKICEAKSDKSSIDEPPEVELKGLPPRLEYIFLEGDDKFPVIIAKDLSIEEKNALITVLKSHKRAIAWKLSDIKGIDPEFCTHKILMEEDFKLAVQHQRRINPKIQIVIKQEVLKLLDAGLIYLIFDSPWVSPVHCVPKKGGFTVVENEKNELILTRLVTGWRVCIDYCKLNEATRKDHFPLPFIDQMLERLAENQYYCFLDGFFAYFQIPIDLKDHEKTTFACPYGTFSYRHMPFGLCNAPGANSFQACLSHLEKMLKRCEDTNLCLNWEKSHFMVKEGIVLGHNISKEGIEVDKGKVDVITKLPHPKNCQGDFAIGAVLGQRQEKHFRPIQYGSKTMTEAKSNYTTKEKEILVVVYAFEKFWSFLIMDKSIVYTDHSALKYLFAKKDSKERLLCWVLLHQEFTFKVIDTKRAENLVVDHLSRLENPHQNVLDPKEINESFPLETLNLVSTRGNSSTLWFPDFANYHAGNFIFKRMSKVQLNELNELRDQAYENSLIYKEKTKRLHDSKIKDRVFNIGDRVLLFNSRLKIFSGKLKSCLSGPFTISHVFPYGTVELSQPDGPNFKVNGHTLKHYFREDIPKMVVPDLQTFPKDH
nr:reverse transcriptase domain-containing protein [Tanacetum cinerariifolium]